MMVPGSRRRGEGATPAWGIACIVIPHVNYCFYGDAATLRENYALMKRYLRYLEEKSKDGIVEFGLGDWCPPGSIRPGFRDLISQDATTLWETWEKYSIDNADRPRSRNHPMQTAFASFFFRNLGGLAIDEGFGGEGVLRYAPSLPAKLDSCRVEYRSRYGTIVSAWNKAGLELTLPPGLRYEFIPNAGTEGLPLTVRRS